MKTLFRLGITLALAFVAVLVPTRSANAYTVCDNGVCGQSTCTIYSDTTGEKLRTYTIYHNVTC